MRQTSTVTSSVNREKHSERYNHAKWASARSFFRFLLRTLGTSLLFKVDEVQGLENIPKDGKAILMINHIAWADPIIVIHVMPRQIVPLGKEEAWDYPIIGLIPKYWGAIPVKRGAVSLDTFRRALAVLDAGEILLLAPEGTRNTEMRRGLEGVAYIGGRSGAPIIPVSLSNTEGYPTLPIFSRWRQPGARLTFGRPFRYRDAFRRPKRDQLRKMTDEAMYVLAAMLPNHRRGVYADLDQATQDTIEWV